MSADGENQTGNGNKNRMTANKQAKATQPPAPEPVPGIPPPLPAGEPAPVAEAAPAPAPAAEAVPDPRDAEIAALKDRLLRLQADFDNFRKRMARDREENARRACETLLKDLLPVADHLELGVRSAHKHHIKHTVTEGFESVQKQMEQVLVRAGVAVIETKGQTFDPRIHECIAHVPSEEHAENTIIEETRRGYKLGNYVLRAPQVIISNGPAAPAPESSGEGTGNTDD